MAGFMIDNIAKGTLKQWYLEDVDTISEDESAVLLDVRTVNEFSRGHIDGFKNIPVDELRERINEIEKGKPVYLICQSGLRSYIASRILEGNGYETYNFSGGFRFYDAVINDRALIERSYTDLVQSGTAGWHSNGAVSYSAAGGWDVPNEESPCPASAVLYPHREQ